MNKYCFMKRLFVAASCLFIIGCDQKVSNRSHNTVSKDNLELRVIDFVLIDPATGLPPAGAGYLIDPPRGDYPSLGKMIDHETEPFRFQYTWIAEKDEETIISVRVDGFEETKIGMDKVTSCSSHLTNTRIPLQKIILTPAKADPAGNGLPDSRDDPKSDGGGTAGPESEGRSR